MDSDTISLLKSAMVELGSDRKMLVLYSYHTELREGSESLTDKTKSFYRCDACSKTVKGWKKLADDLMNSNPAGILTTEELGMFIPSGVYKIHYGDKYMTHSSFSRWINMKMNKRRVSHYVWCKKAFQGVQPFLRILQDSCGRTFDISDAERLSLQDDNWIGNIVVKGPRKKPKIIF